MMGSGRREKLPVIILTGFLGSGKTTLLNRVLTRPEFLATAVIVNEFGEVGIDHLLVETSNEQMIEMNNGCICCTIRGDLADKLGSLAMWIDVGRIPPVERVIVETTGLADPAPIMHTLMTSDSLLERYRLDRVVTMVDAIAGLDSLARFPEAVKQTAVADELVISKHDLVERLSSPEHFGDLMRELRRLNSRARVHEADHGDIGLQLLRGPSGGEVDAIIGDFPAWLHAAESECHAEHCADPGHDHYHGSRHRGIASFVVRFGAIPDMEDFNRFLQDLLIEFGSQFLRLKGIVAVAERPDAPAVIHGVQHVLFPATWLRGWPDGEHSSKLVFIVDDLDPKIVRRRFDGHFASAAALAGLSPPGDTAHAFS